MILSNESLNEKMKFESSQLKWINKQHRKTEPSIKRTSDRPDAPCKWGRGRASWETCWPRRLRRWRRRLDHSRPSPECPCQDQTTANHKAILSKNSIEYQIISNDNNLKMLIDATCVRYVGRSHYSAYLLHRLEVGRQTCTVQTRVTDKNTINRERD